MPNNAAPWEADAPVTAAAPAAPAGVPNAAAPWEADAPVKAEAAAPGAAPKEDKQTAVGAVHAVGAGINAGALDVLGIPTDTARNLVELGKAGAGFIYHEATGKPIPDALQPEDESNYKNDIGSSDWLKDQARTRLGSAAIDAEERTTLNKYLHAGGEGVVPGIVGGPQTAARSAAGGIAASAAQQAVADSGGGAVAQGAVGILAGHVAGKAFERPHVTELPPRSQVEPPPPGGFTPESLQAEGAARRAAAAKPPAETAAAPSAAPEPSAAASTAVPKIAPEPPKAAPPAPVEHKPSGPVDIHLPNGRPFSVVSAERGERSPADNAAHTQQLGDQLKASGLPFQPTEGSYQGTAEPSYAVQTPTANARAQVEALAKAHDQESVLHVDSDRNGAYHYMADGREEPQGKWTPASPETAQAQPGYTRDSAGQHYVMAPAEPAKPLDGLPQKPLDIPGYGTVTPGPSEKIRQVAQDYMKSTGREYNPPTDYRSVVPEQMKGIADAYDAMPHNPNDPKVKAAYDALTKETMAQWEAIKKSGLKVDFIKPGQADPYAASPRLAIEDLKNNNHMWVYPTDAGFGSAGSDVSNHPLLKNSGETISGQQAKVNDIFRVVHDYFGHGAEGNGFRADGEYNAWRQHNAMYSDAARPALASETLGQNSWVNFGPHGEANRHASSANTIFADQKAGVMPDAVWKGAAGDHEPASGQVPATPADWISGPPKLSNTVSFKKPADEGSTHDVVTPAEQAEREATLRSLPGLREVRASAVTGDTKSAGTDFQTSKVDNAAGRRMAEVIGNERAAVRAGADDLVARSGGTDGMEQSDLYRRGTSITSPLDTYNTYLDDATQRVYDTATQRLGGKPIPALTETQNYLKSNKSNFLGTVEGKQLLEGVNARMKELGFLGDNETFNPPTVEQAERFRQYLGDQWTPRTARLIGALKQSLDNDVGKAAGEDVYGQARMINTLRNKMLVEPKGVGKLLAPDDRLGINRDVPLENVPKYVTSMPVDQFGHFVNVLKQAGMTEGAPQMSQQAAHALNEIRAQFMNEYRAAGNSTDGMWNAKAANSYLTNNQARIAMVFSPEELQRIKVHNDAAAYLRMDRSYPGAAAQKQNLLMRGVLGTIEHGATMAGAAFGELPGAAAGALAGQAAKKISEAGAKRSVESRIRRLDTPQTAPGGSDVSEAERSVVRSRIPKLPEATGLANVGLQNPNNPGATAAFGPADQQQSE